MNLSVEGLEKSNGLLLLLLLVAALPFLADAIEVLMTGLSGLGGLARGSGTRCKYCVTLEASPNEFTLDGEPGLLELDEDIGDILESKKVQGLVGEGA